MPLVETLPEGGTRVLPTEQQLQTMYKFDVTRKIAYTYEPDGNGGRLYIHVLINGIPLRCHQAYFWEFVRKNSIASSQLEERSYEDFPLQ